MYTRAELDSYRRTFKVYLADLSKCEFHKWSKEDPIMLLFDLACNPAIPDEYRDVTLMARQLLMKHQLFIMGCVSKSTGNDVKDNYYRLFILCEESMKDI